MRRSFQFRPGIGDQLEDRTVMSGAGAKLVPLVTSATGSLKASASIFNGGLDGFGGGSAGALNLAGGTGSSLVGKLGGASLGGGACVGGQGLATSSVLAQDAQVVRQAFQTFHSTYLTAVAALRKTATTTAGPTAAGLATFNTTIETAITKLNTTISTALAANLPNTASAVLATITSATSDLQTSIESAATGLANSTNAAVLAMNKEVNGYIRSALQTSVNAVLTNTTPDSLTSSTIQTYHQAVKSAYQAFSTAIASAAQTSISSGAKLDATAVGTAITNLQTALDGAIAGLGTAFTSSTSNPSTTVATKVSDLSTALMAITAPTAGNSASARLFLKTVNSTINSALSGINQSVATSIQSYNASLL